jgi:probable HAF family extracellular repeat protein
MILRNSARCHRHRMTAITAAVVLAALGVVGSVPVWAAEKAAKSKAVDSAPDQSTASHKNKNDVGIRGHGFVADHGVFTTIDAPGAGAFTVVFGIDENGRTVGGYVDDQGRLHGFLKDKEAFTVIDFSGAAATFVSQINDRGQMVGAYSRIPNTPLLQAEYGFLLDNGDFTTIDVPGAVQTRLFGINNQGQIVGEYLDTQDMYHGFLLDNGVFTTIDAPAPAIGTTATSIDDSGRIVGTAFPGPTTVEVHGFIWSNGEFTMIDVPGFERTQATGINNLGQVVGYANNLDGPAHGFVLDNGAFTIVDAPDAQLTTRVFDINDAGQLAGAYDFVTHGYFQDRKGRFSTIDVPGPVVRTVPFNINNREEIVGYYIDAGETQHGFFRDRRGAFTAVEFPGALGTSANSINDAGQIVGSYSTVTNRGHASEANAFLLENGTFTNIDPPGATRAQAFGINNRGEIVGEVRDAAGNFHGFLRDNNGNFTMIDVPGALATVAQIVTDRGQILGAYVDAAGVFHGFLLDEEGVFTTIETPEVSLPSGPSLPQHLTVAGFNGDAKGLHHGFLLDGGRFTRLSGPTAFGESVPAFINARGQIVGFYE